VLENSIPALELLINADQLQWQ